MGRKALAAEGPKGRYLQVRVTDAERETMRAAFGERNVSARMRELALAEARRVLAEREAEP